MSREEQIKIRRRKEHERKHAQLSCQSEEKFEFKLHGHNNLKGKLIG